MKKKKHSPGRSKTDLFTSVLETLCPPLPMSVGLAKPPTEWKRGLYGRSQGLVSSSEKRRDRPMRP
jgi:hypothetical protein